jgi:hypothetical protein
VDKGFASVEAKIGDTNARMERGFAAVADDIADIKHEMATKNQIIASTRRSMPSRPTSAP